MEGRRQTDEIEPCQTSPFYAPHYGSVGADPSIITKMAENAKPTGKRVILGCAGVILGLVIGAAIMVYPLFRDAKEAGFFNKDEMQEYNGNSMKNLKVLHTAAMLYHDSNDMFPNAAHWMDAISLRIQADNMSDEEAMEKLKNPFVAKENPLAFGYAFNDDVSEMFIDDITDPAKTPLIFDSSDTTYNAHGLPAQLAPEPPRPGGNLAVTVEGNVVQLSELLGN